MTEILLQKINEFLFFYSWDFFFIFVVYPHWQQSIEGYN